LPIQGVAMNISGTSALASVASVGTSSYSSSSVTNTSQTNPSASSTNNFMRDVFQALDSIGVNLPPPPPPGSSQGADNSDDKGANNAVGQALHEMMHSLLQALKAPGAEQDNNNGDASIGGLTGAGSRYDNLISNLQNLISSLNTDKTTGADQKLEDSFNNLINLLGGQSSSESKPTVQDFLGQLLNNLNHSTASVSSASSVGSIISTTV